MAFDGRLTPGLRAVIWLSSSPDGAVEDADQDGAVQLQVAGDAGQVVGDRHAAEESGIWMTVARPGRHLGQVARAHGHVGVGEVHGARLEGGDAGPAAHGLVVDLDPEFLAEYAGKAAASRGWTKLDPEPFSWPPGPSGRPPGRRRWSRSRLRPWWCWTRRSWSSGSTSWRSRRPAARRRPTAATTSRRRAPRGRNVGGVRTMLVTSVSRGGGSRSHPGGARDGRRPLSTPVLPGPGERAAKLR